MTIAASPIDLPLGAVISGHLLGKYYVSDLFILINWSVRSWNRSAVLKDKRRIEDKVIRIQ